MNPLTNMKNVTKLSEQELHNNSKSSWHDQYRDSAWVFIGGLPYDLTEGDIICIFSQYGEVVNINLIRDKDNGKSKGFCFLCYEDQRSTILAVDNLNGIKVLNRILRVDHVSEYKVPKEGKKTGEETKKLYSEGCAPKPFVPIVKNPLVENLEYRRETLADQIQADIRLPARLPIRTEVKREKDLEDDVKVKIEPTGREERVKDSSESENEVRNRSEKKKKRKRHRSRDNSTESDSEDTREYGMKQKSSEKKHRKRNRSRSNERHKKSAGSDQIDSRNVKIKSRHRSRSRSIEKRYRDAERKDNKEKISTYSKNKNEAYRRRSRS